MFTNKHVIIAVLVAPVLAVIAYFAVDKAVSEKPHNAVTGASYPLIAKSNCRYGSGKCTFKNGDMKFDITLKEQDKFLLVTLTSEIPLDGVHLSMSEASVDLANPKELTLVSTEPHTWQGRYNISYTGEELLRMVASTGGSAYYGETVAAFGRRISPYGNAASFIPN